jgi:hypothetical protein
MLKRLQMQKFQGRGPADVGGVQLTEQWLSLGLVKMVFMFNFGALTFLIRSHQ